MPVVVVLHERHPFALHRVGHDHTVKGKGVSFMEDDNNWHYRAPNPQELAAALAELEPV